MHRLPVAAAAELKVRRFRLSLASQSHSTRIHCRASFVDAIPQKNISVEATLQDSYDSEVLDCGKAVNFTYYDDLIGVAQRYNHPIVPEPEVWRTYSLIVRIY